METKKTLLALVALVATTAVSFGVVIDFAGGIATLSDTSTVVTDNFTTYEDVVSYVEDGIRIDFIGGLGIIGNYYGGFPGGEQTFNSVIHMHDAFPGGRIEFSKVDGTTMDLNYVVMSSNTDFGGGPASGQELSYITNDLNYSMLLPSSDWGIDWDSGGQIPGDGVKQLFLDSNFDDIASFTITSENAYCIGLDNFYIDEIPEPATMVLLGLGGLILRKRKK